MHMATINWALAVVLAASGGQAGFTARPAAVRDGDRVKVSFSVSGPTDVEVAILDGQGRTVRHLAAGVLGGANPPPPPLEPGLAQELTWDGKDDKGLVHSTVRAGGAGAVKVRVRLGMEARLDGFVGESKYWVGELHGLAVDPKGNLYVYSSSVPEHRGSSRYLQVFDRAGKYLRTIMPMPANLAADKLKAFNVIVFADGGFCPRNNFGTWPELYPGRVGQLVPMVTPDGVVGISDGFSLARVGDDGSAVDGPLWRPLWPAERDKRPGTYEALGPRHVVPSPDGKHLYVTGMCHGLKLGKEADLKVHPNFPDGRIYRLALGPDGGPAPGCFMERFADLPLPENVRVFAETKDGYRAQDYHTALHTGLDRSCFDKEGNLLVCDRMNGMVRGFSPDGRDLGGFKVDHPASVVCDRRTGAVYVMTNQYVANKGTPKSLLKFSSPRPDARQLARLDFDPRGHDAVMVIDDFTGQGNPPVIWAAGDLTGRRSVLRIEDRSDKLEIIADLLDLNTDRFGVKPRLAVHPQTDLVICNDGRATLNGYNGLTGERVALPFEYGADMAVGLDGNWYIQTGNNYSGPICRFDRDLKPLPVEGADPKLPNQLGMVYGRMGAGFCTVGMAADARGRVLSMQMYTWSGYAVVVFGPDGKPEDRGRMKDDPELVRKFSGAVIGPIATKPGGLQVDFQDNIYVGLGVIPADHVPPAGFEKDRGYTLCTGSVVRFGPQGGAIVALDPKNPQPPEGRKGLVLMHNSYGRGPRFLENGAIAYPGLGCMAGDFGDGCICRQPMFQVDGFGRIFYPNAITCSVRVVDNSGNEVLRFGRYANIDATGPKDLPVADVPLGWPEAVAVSEKALYVSDVLNRRIVRLVKKYAAEEVCPVK